MPITRLVWVLVLMAVTAWCSRDNISTRLATSQSVRANKPVSNLQRYTVVKGDSLLMISVRLGIPYQTIAAWNGLQAPFLLKEGQVLTLSPPKNFARLTPPAPKTAATPKVRSHKVVLKPDWQWPASGPVVRQFDGDANKGLDIAVKPGQAVMAVAAGRVIYAGDSILGYGNLLIIKHDDEFMTAYGNNRRLLVKSGDEVVKGQTVAESADHLATSMVHFEIRKQGEPVNPQDYLPLP